MLGNLGDFEPTGFTAPELICLELNKSAVPPSHTGNPLEVSHRNKLVTDSEGRSRFHELNDSKD